MKLSKETLQEYIYGTLETRYKSALESNVGYIVDIGMKYNSLHKEYLDLYFSRRESNGFGSSSNSSERELELKELIQPSYCKESKKELRPLLIRDLAVKYSNTIVDNFSSKKSTDKAIEKVTSLMTKEHNKKLDALSKSIQNDLKKLSIEKVVLGDSDNHDLCIELLVDSKWISYTINTIVAGGNIQIIHLRTLTKIHKKSVSVF